MNRIRSGGPTSGGVASGHSSAWSTVTWGYRVGCPSGGFLDGDRDRTWWRHQPGDRTWWRHQLGALQKSKAVQARGRHWLPGAERGPVQMQGELRGTDAQDPAARQGGRPRMQKQCPRSTSQSFQPSGSLAPHPGTRACPGLPLLTTVPSTLIAFHLQQLLGRYKRGCILVGFTALWTVDTE